MNITIIGATRGIGKETLTQAIEENHNVVALVRDTSKLDVEYDKLNIINGDFTNYDSVKESIKEADAVVVSVGAMPSRKPVTLFSEGTIILINAIKELNINPLVITVTGIGAGDSEGHGNFFYDKIFKPFLLQKIYDDKNRQEEILRNEYNNWIIVRPGFLTNGSKIGQYQVYTDVEGVKAGKISRADVADFILKQAINPTYIKKTPLISY